MNSFFKPVVFTDCLLPVEIDVKTWRKVSIAQSETFSKIPYSLAAESVKFFAMNFKI